MEIHLDGQRAADGAITGVVDWVETSTGPAWLDAGHAATNLAVAYGVEPARRFLELYAARAEEPAHAHWLVMDAVGFLPPPGREPMLGEPSQLERLDEWLDLLVRGEVSRARSPRPPARAARWWRRPAPRRRRGR